MEKTESTDPAGTQISEVKPKTDADNLIEGSSLDANASTTDATIVDSKVEDHVKDSKEENKKEFDENKAKNTIIHSLASHINKNFERLGRKFEEMNRQEQYESFLKKITRVEKKMKYQVKDQGWKKGIIVGSLELFKKDTLSLETVDMHLKEFGEQAAD